jgi:polysaccharide transporter, PST family
MTNAISRKTLTGNALSLYGVQFCRKLLPFLCVPYLARVLGPSGWGRVAFAVAFGEILVMLIEFGFNLSATRELARHRDSKEHCRTIAAGVLGAQAVLCAAAIAGGLVVGLLVPGLRNYPKLFGAGLFYGIAQGVAPLWFFQGLERMGTGAVIEISGKLLSVACVFAVAHVPSDDWKVVLVQALPSATSAIVGIAIIQRFVGLERPRFSEIRAALKRGWPLFLFRSGIGLYGLANAFVLGLFAPAVQVGYYASSEKISKAASGLLSPLREALYPRLSNLARHSPLDAQRLARAGSWLATTAGFLISLTLYVLAPFIIRTLMGSGFGPSVAVLRILSVLPLVIAVTESIGLQRLLPQGRDMSVTRIIYSGGLLNLVLSFVLARRFGHIGMAWAVVTAETFVALRMSWAALNVQGNNEKPAPGPSLAPEACLAGSGS